MYSYSAAIWPGIWFKSSLVSKLSFSLFIICCFALIFPFPKYVTKKSSSSGNRSKSLSSKVSTILVSNEVS